jgi:hypothetical protein
MSDNEIIPSDLSIKELYSLIGELKELEEEGTLLTVDAMFLDELLQERRERDGKIYVCDSCEQWKCELQSGIHDAPISCPFRGDLEEDHTPWR